MTADVEDVGVALAFERGVSSGESKFLISILATSSLLFRGSGGTLTIARVSLEASTSRVGQIPQRGKGAVVDRTAQDLQGAGDQCGFVKRRGGGLLEPSGEPPKCIPLATSSIAETDQAGELERLAQVKLADLARLDLRDDDVAAARSPGGILLSRAPRKS
jgi:hypothetical protein